MWQIQIQKLLTFFSKNISVYAISNDKNFNDALTNDIFSFEQLGPGIQNAIQESPDNKTTNRTKY